MPDDASPPQTGHPGPDAPREPARPVYTNTLVIELLHRFPALAMFSEEDIRKILYSGRFIRLDHFAPGALILREGDMGAWMFMLIKGAVRVMKQGLEICVLRRQGDVIGEMGSLGRAPRSATVTALEPTVCVGLNMDAIENMTAEEKGQYLGRLKTHFAPLIDERLRMTEEVADILFEIRQKEHELARLRDRLKGLGVSDERSILEILLEGL